jgi:hypothetical protein
LDTVSPFTLPAVSLSVLLRKYRARRQGDARQE